MLVDNKPPVDPKFLKDLINAQVTLAREMMTQEIANLRKAVHNATKQPQDNAGDRGKNLLRKNKKKSREDEQMDLSTLLTEETLEQKQRIHPEDHRTRKEANHPNVAQH